MPATPRPWKAIFFETSQTWEVTNDAGGDLSEEYSIFEHLTEDDARLIVRSVNCHDELMAAVRAARHYVNEAAQDPLNVPAANKLDAQLASVLKKAEEHT